MARTEVPRKGGERTVFVQHLRRRGLRLTREREAILAEVGRTDGHFRADDLLVRCHQRKVPVSRATIYRTLDILVEAGLVRRETFHSSGAHYERAHEVQGHGHHDHLYCVSCGAIFEFHNQEIEILQERVCEEFGFEPLSHSHQISGLCRTCQRTKDGPARGSA